MKPPWSSEISPLNKFYRIIPLRSPFSIPAGHHHQQQQEQLGQPTKKNIITIIINKNNKKNNKDNQRTNQPTKQSNKQTNSQTNEQATKQPNKQPTTAGFLGCRFLLERVANIVGIIPWLFSGFRSPSWRVVETSIDGHFGQKVTSKNHCYLEVQDT